MSNDTNANTKITTGMVRLSYVQLTNPQSRNGEEPKYSVTVLLPKSDVATKQRIDQAVEAAIQKGVSTWGGRPPQVNTPIHDGDGARPSDGMPYGSECKDHWVFTASTKNKPGVVDANLSEIINPMEIYSGMYGRVSVSFFAYNSNGRKGVGCGLNNVQKLQDGEPLSGSSTPEEDFATPYSPPAAGAFAAPQQNQWAPQTQAPQQNQWAPQTQAPPTIDPITGQVLSDPDLPF